VVIDFQFAMVNKKDILLVSGAICNNLNKHTPIKLEGRPIILTEEGKLQIFHTRNYEGLLKHLKMIFRKKPDVLTPLLGQLHQSVVVGGNRNLGTTFLNHYIFSDRNRKPVVVFWNGDMDRKILKKLRINNIKRMLNITKYSDNNDNYFSLKLIDMNNNKLLYSRDIGYKIKNGRMLNLKEAHDLVCIKRHEISHCHDPVTDVDLTRCIFNIIVSDIKPIKLYKICR
jgi:hypothetical protein